MNIATFYAHLDPTLNSGFFPVPFGRINRFTHGIGTLNYDASLATIRVATVHQVTGDSLSIHAIFFADYIEVFFIVNNGFLNNDSYPI